MINLINGINAIVLGHVITYLAIFLNFTHGDQYLHDGKLGISLAIIGLAASYFHECMYARGTKHPCLAPIFYWTSIVSVTLSYFVWLMY